MQRGQNEMAGERRLDGDLRRLEVPNLSDEHDVGILAQERAQRRGEVEADVLADLDLIDPRQVELDGILRRHDVDVGLVERRERRVERISSCPNRWGP